MQENEKWSEVAQSCPTLCDPMYCSPPGSSVHGIFQARVLEWVAIAFSYYIPLRMVQIQNTGYTKYWQRCGATGTLSHSWWECKMVQALWKTVWLFLTEVNRLLSYSSAIAPLCIYSSELKIYVYTKTPHRRLIITLFITARTWEQPRCPSISEQINCDISRQWNVVQS